MASDTILKLRDAIKEIEQGRATCKQAAPSSYELKTAEARACTLRKSNVASCECSEMTNVAFDDDEVKDVSPEAAFKRILKLVAVRDRCRSELTKRLLAEEFPLEHIEEALDRAERVLIVDDIRFAEQFIRGRISAGKGSAGIERELINLQIEPSAVPGWPYEFFSEDDEFDRAFTFIRNHPPRSKNLRESAYRKLVQKGYGSDVAASVSRAWFENLKK